VPANQGALALALAKSLELRGREVETYTPPQKERAYNPPVGLVTPDTDRDGRRVDHWAL
jgi:hypothetical protein